MKDEQIRVCGNCQFYAEGACSAPRPWSLRGFTMRFKVQPENGSECGVHRFKVIRKRKDQPIGEVA